ncbi:MAG: DUF4199 domain-containing protein [Cyclobacteriaceae bacterium]
MEEQSEKVTIKQLGLKWGPILGLISFAYFMVLVLTGNSQNQSISWLGLIFSIAIMIMAHKSFKDEGNGFMSFGEGFKIGALISVISSIISTCLTYVYIKFLDESYMEMVKEKAISDMEKKGMNEGEIDQAMEFASFFMTAEFIFIVGILMGIIMGCILALIISAFTKKTDPSTEF